MDKNAVPTYPGRPAEQDLHPVKQDSLERELPVLSNPRLSVKLVMSLLIVGHPYWRAGSFRLLKMPRGAILILCCSVLP